jgi:hypothetical protein
MHLGEPSVSAIFVEQAAHPVRLSDHVDAAQKITVLAANRAVR